MFTSMQRLNQTLRLAMIPQPDPRFYTAPTTYANQRRKLGLTSFANMHHEHKREIARNKRRAERQALKQGIRAWKTRTGDAENGYVSRAGNWTAEPNYGRVVNDNAKVEVAA